MGFWIFMLCMDLLCPLIMIVFGKAFLNRAPKEINDMYGYRTTMSRKNMDTWEFAHHYFGKLWYVGGIITLIITVIVMIPVVGQSEDIIGTVGGVLCTVQMLPLIGAIIPTENALKRTFDQNGDRR